MAAMTAGTAHSARVREFDSIGTPAEPGAMRATAPRAPGVAIARGFWAPGDGGGGVFHFDSAATTPDDGGTVIAVSGLAKGRWRRLYSGPLNVKWFGARGNGSANDHDAIQHALVAATSATTQGGAVYFPGGNPDAAPPTGKYVTTALNITHPTVLTGDGREKSSLVLADTAIAPLLMATGGLELRGLRIDGGSGPDGIDWSSRATRATLRCGGAAWSTRRRLA